MSAVEEIQAAIEKLTELRYDSTLATWSVDEIPETGECRVIREFEFFGMQIEAVTSGGSQRADADLIVTLHRTIDAQLALLEASIADRTPRYFDYELEAHFEAVLALPLLFARAINGTV